MNRIAKRYYIILFLLAFFALGTNAIAGGPFEDFEKSGFEIGTGFNMPTKDMKDGQFSLVRTTCGMYPGFFNKIVKCLTRMVTREAVFFNIWKISNVFSGAANAALILYIVFFGLRMSLNALENVRSDIIVFLLTCFFITYVNNHLRIIDFLKFFMTVQNEFASVATVALYSSVDGQISKDKKKFVDCIGGTTCTSEAQINAKISEMQNKYQCYGPKDPTSPGGYFPKPGVYYNIWQRMDCLVVYMMGAHPLTTRLQAHLADCGESDPLALANTLLGAAFSNPNNQNPTFNIDLNKNDPSTGQKIISSIGAFSARDNHSLFFSPNSPFQDPLFEPFCFSKVYDKDLFIGTPDLAKINKLKNLLSDICFLRFIGITQAEYEQIMKAKSANDILSIIPKMTTNFTENYVKKPRVNQGDKMQTNLVFSFIIILVGSLFSSEFGLVMALLGFMTIFLMFFAFAQAVLIYITSLLALLFLGLFAPIIIPCFLFKNTRGIFDNWLQLFFVYSIQPGLVLCYISIMIIVLQHVMFNPAELRKIGKDTDGNYVYSEEKVSYTDLILGDKYKKGCATSAPILEIYSQQTQGENTSPAGMDNAEGQSTRPCESASIYGSAGNQYAVASSDLMACDLQSPTGFKTKNTGATFESINVPSFKFFGQSFDTKAGVFGNLLGGSSRNSAVTASIRDFVSASPIDADTEQSKIEIMQNRYTDPMTLVSTICKYDADGRTTTCTGPPSANDNNPFKKAIDIQTQVKATETNYSLLLIHTLMVMIIILSITLSFLHNVMEFATSLAGVGATPASKVANVYSIFATKLHNRLQGHSSK